MRNGKRIGYGDLLTPRCYLIAAGLFLLVSCHGPQPTEIALPPPPVEPFTWSTSTPQAQQLDSAMIAEALRAVEARRYIQSFLIVRNGVLAVERYNTSTGKYTNAEVASVSKSIMSAVVGITYQQHYLDSLDQKLLDIFPEYVTPTLDPRKRSITVEDLLTMRAGFNFVESDPNNATIFNRAADWVGETINLPLLYHPGQAFGYATPVAHLLSPIVTRKSHMSTKALADSFLFKPAKITVLSWPQDPQGYYLGGTGMVFYPRDLARFGYLYTSNGFLGGRQLIPADWVRRSVSSQVDLHASWGDIGDVNYGYLWWTGSWNTDTLFFAVGYGGQLIVGAPRARMVVVVTSDLNCTSAEADQRHLDILAILTRHVLPAARN